MLKIFNVYSGRLHIDFVYALNKEHAINMTVKKWGDPRTYTVTSDGTYWVVEA